MYLGEGEKSYRDFLCGWGVFILSIFGGMRSRRRGCEGDCCSCFTFFKYEMVHTFMLRCIKATSSRLY